MSSQDKAEAEDDPVAHYFWKGNAKTAVFFVLDNHAVQRRDTQF